MMRMHSITLAERKDQQGAAPVFMYLFTWETPVLNGRLKSCHALEIPFVFDTLAYARRFTGESPERFALAEQMSEAWLAFAHSGIPSFSGLPSWPAYNSEQRATMIFDQACQVVNDPGGELRQAWKRIPIPSLNE
jgi:para-nitrobenzyl esterase